MRRFWWEARELFCRSLSSSEFVGAWRGVRRPASTVHEKVSRTPPKCSGCIKVWHPIDRQGIIVEKSTGKEYVIANPRAFETVLPTLLRTLEGATVLFDVCMHPTKADRVIIRSRTEPITARSYDLQPPIDYVNPLRNQVKEERKADGALAEEDAQEQRGVSTARYAENIIVDLQSIPSDKLMCLSGPLVGEEAVAPTRNCKDLRSVRIFDSETNEYIRLRQRLGSAEAARAVIEKQRAEVQRVLPQRVVLAKNVEGIVLAWSAIHRNGVVVEGCYDAPEDVRDVDSFDQKDISVIRNVQSFQSALPTSQNLLHRRVLFDKVTYSNLPGKAFAEKVVVQGQLGFDAAAATVEAVKAAKEEAKRTTKRQSLLQTPYAPEEEEGAHSPNAADLPQNCTSQSRTSAAPEVNPLPKGPTYGVITRWSGGQGTVESGDGHTYYIESAAAFVQLIEQTSHGVRGAVVTFCVDAAHPRYATNVNILSLASSSAVELKPLLDRVPGSASQRTSQDTSGHATLVAVNDATGKQVPRCIDVEPEGVEWLFGTLVSWSPQENQGIIDAEDGNRYVLKDANDNVIHYASCKGILKKGRKLKFTAFGNTGMLACNVVTLDAEAEEEEMRIAELRPKEPKLTLDGNMDEAIPAPTSTSYWISRLERSGFDVSEVKNLQGRAIDPNEVDKDDLFMDSDDLLKKDRWWNDSERNKRFPNSKMRVGDMKLVGPASLLNVALKAQDPKRLHKMVDKYQSKLTEEQKEEAWRRAKEMAPKFEKLIKDARKRNEEPQFNFF